MELLEFVPPKKVHTTPKFYKDITFLPKHGKFFLFLVAKHEHALYDKEKVAKTNETEKDDRSSTKNEVIASAELTEQVVTFNICAVKAAEKVAIVKTPT